MNSFVDEVKDHIIYLHIVDALGSDGEGISNRRGRCEFW